MTCLSTSFWMHPEDACIGQNCRVLLICQNLWRGNGSLYLRLYHPEQLWGSQFLNSASIHPTLTDWQIVVNGCCSKLQSRYYRLLVLLALLDVGCLITFMLRICLLLLTSEIVIFETIILNVMSFLIFFVLLFKPRVQIQRRDAANGHYSKPPIIPLTACTPREHTGKFLKFVTTVSIWARPIVSGVDC